MNLLTVLEAGVQDEGVGRFGFSWGLSSWLEATFVLCPHMAFFLYTHLWCLFLLIWTPVLLASGPNFMTSCNLNDQLKTFIHLFTELSYSLSYLRLGLQHVHGGKWEGEGDNSVHAGSKGKAVLAFRKVWPRKVWNTCLTWSNMPEKACVPYSEWLYRALPSILSHCITLGQGPQPEMCGHLMWWHLFSGETVQEPPKKLRPLL